LIVTSSTVVVMVVVGGVGVFFRIYAYSRVVVAVFVVCGKQEILRVRFFLRFEWRSPSIKKLFN